MVSINDPRTRRKILASSGALLGGSLAGCISGGGGGSGDGDGGGSTDTGGDGDSTTTDAGGGAETYEVGYGEFETTVSASEFPEKLYVYAVQTGWSNWGAIMQAFQDQYGVALNDDQRSSGEALSDLRANAQDPTHSAYNGGYTFGILAMKDGLTQAYKPANWDKVPDKLKTDNGHMTATRRMTTALTYRKDIFEERGIEEPETWEDLKNPDIAQDLVIQPPQAAVGLAGALSINNAYGGSLDNVQPVIEYMTELQDMGTTFRGNLEGDFTKGNIGSFVEYDYTGLDLKYNSDAIAEEKVGVTLLNGVDGNKGAMNQPYGYGMLKGAPNPEACKLFMDYVLSLEGQKQFLDAYVRPIRAPELELPEEFPAQSRYEETQFQVDYTRLVENQESIIQNIGEGVGLTGY
ncbi:extracellular solute-binding protein [Halobellus ruber]|uniref:Extracellular solute-binding protein n=1 Tax=Halobellus ruber TaxID=2761102 RepID=A0A7J9SI41_9EURY|nr:extracellular solute-binding protein [Halobellus ruber]MBB6645647.1 extracellular solute-binding protein [Halobellus ruber]